MYNPRTFAQVKEVYPNVNWDRFFIETMGIKSPDTLIVTEPEYLAQADKLMGSLSPTARSGLLSLEIRKPGRFPKLSDNFTQASFEFSKVMSGVQELRPLWKRAIDATEALSAKL